MSWAFEHWDNGKVYLHEQRWNDFRKDVEKTGLGYLHNYNHNRIFCRIYTPRDRIEDLPAIGLPDLKYKVEGFNKWNVIYQPYPAFVRTNEDPEGWLPSWNLWSEDNNTGDELLIFHTGNISRVDDIYSFGITIRNYFVSFQGKFWLMDNYKHYGIGPHSPPPPAPKVKKLCPRSIFEDFEEPW